MDLSKAFDCIPHGLLIAKLNAYGIDENALVLIYSSLKRREQSVRINNTYSSFQTLSTRDLDFGSLRVENVTHACLPHFHLVSSLV